MDNRYKPDPDLLFTGKPLTPASPVDIVFGAEQDSGVQNVGAVLSGLFNDFRIAAAIGPLVDMTLAFRLDDFCIAAAGAYHSDCDRPMVQLRSMSYSTAGRLQKRVSTPNTAMLNVRSFADLRSAMPAKIASRTGIVFTDLRKIPASASVCAFNAVKQMATTRISYADLQRFRGSVSIRTRRTGELRQSRSVSYRELARLRTSTNGAWHEALKSHRGHQSGSRTGTAAIATFRSRYDEAIVPRIGRSTDVPVKPPIVYQPDSHLVFWQKFNGSSELVFGLKYIVPGATRVVPIRSAYIVLNNVEVKRRDGGELPVTSMSMSVDMDSWTWSFSMNLPGSAKDLLKQYGNDPVLLDTNINGKPYVLIAERLQRTRQFGNAGLTLSGRGLSAMLADPYSPVSNFNAATDKTAQQLMNDALTINGVSLGWTVDWRIDDWLVPAGAWNTQGSYMDAVNAIAQAAGAFVQPHAKDKTLIIRPRFPYKPWDMAGVVADFELPADVVVTESVEWEEKPFYDTVYVSGTTDRGLLGQIKRAGFAGNKPAPMVTDPLLTDLAVLRARGAAVLTETGKISRYSLSLPVLPETGIIEPGAVVKYRDSDIMVGVVKGVSFNADMPKLRQTIELEVYG